MSRCKIVVSLCAVFTLAAVAHSQPQTQPAQPQSSQPSSQDPAGAAREQTGRMPASDAQFARDAAADGLAEVELGRLAVEKASSAEVKSFGQMMVEDHSKANEELKALASRKDINLPSDPKPEHKAEKERLEKLSGAAFDQAYAKAMAKEHKKAVDLFSKQASRGADAELKAWAAQKLPTLKQHHAKAAELAGAKGSADGGQER
jgi:putative membrane protein